MSIFEQNGNTSTFATSNHMKWLCNILFTRNSFIHRWDIWKFVVLPLTWIGTAINEYYNISAFCIDFGFGFVGFFWFIEHICIDHVPHSERAHSNKMQKDHIMATIRHITPCMSKKQLNERANERTNHWHSIIMNTLNCISSVARSKFNGEIIVRLKRASHVNAVRQNN